MVRRKLLMNGRGACAQFVMCLLAAQLMACFQNGLTPPQTKACNSDSDCAADGLTCWSSWETTDTCVALKAEYSNCCYAHDGVGCDNEAVQEAVCAWSQMTDDRSSWFDPEMLEERPDCCTGTWTSECAAYASLLKSSGAFSGSNATYDGMCLDYFEGYSARCAPGISFCDRDVNGNGTPDLVDLGMVPSEDCRDCTYGGWESPYFEGASQWGAGCNAQCFSLTGLGGRACEGASDCLSGNCMEGRCCEPDCEDRTCGDDGCGGSCGTCEGLQICGEWSYSAECYCADTKKTGPQCDQCLDSTRAGEECEDAALGTACDSWTTCVEGAYCNGGICDDGAVGKQCESDTDCASKICKTFGEPSNICKADVPASPCTTNSDCSGAGEFCAFDSSDVGRCVTGQAGAPCVDDDHCASGLSCNGERKLEPNHTTSPKWKYWLPYNVCSDGSLGSPCFLDSQCANEEARCVGEMVSTISATSAYPTGDGVCVLPASGSPCQMTLRDHGYDAFCFDYLSDWNGEADCGGVQWGDSGSQLLCQPTADCPVTLTPENSTCLGTCVPKESATQCLMFESDSPCQDGMNVDKSVTTNMSHTTTYGCGRDQFCMSGLCTVGAQGDPCNDDECQAGLKCFNGTCVP